MNPKSNFILTKNYTALKKFTLQVLVSLILSSLVLTGYAQVHIKERPRQVREKEAKVIQHRCLTMEVMEEAIRKNPALVEQWRIEGERQYQLSLQRSGSNQRGQGVQDNPIIVPIVFHLVDAAAALAGITDRDIYEQVEQLNTDYSGAKIAQYLKVIPPEIAARIGNIPVKFVLARRDPAGNLTTGIERRVNATPDHISIKATATGGLDAWDVTKYVNVWAGTFSGADAGLLGIATFPFTTGQGAQGVVIGLTTLPYTSPTTRGYYPNYSEGATLSHEIGHYFYLFHTFGDNSACNNDDFRLQSGWPLFYPSNSTTPIDDDTPDERAGPGNAYFGNPSMNYGDGCTALPFGMMYGSYMNYFDDRALFMFSDGMRKRVESCIALYRPGLLTSDGATPPSAVTDAFLVDVSSRGLPERRSFVVNNTPFQAKVRNSGTTTLTSVTINVKIDAAAAVPTVFPLSLTPGRDTLLTLANISGASGNHTYLVYTTAPNGGTDNFLNNDTLNSYYNIHAGTASLPFTEDFTSATFPPANWVIWNPNSGATNTWVKNTTSGFTAAGSAFFDNYNVNQGGTLDELITPALDLGLGTTAAALTFKVAHAVYDAVDVSTWDGLEVYVSGDGGKTYNLAWKKTGNQLKTIAAAQTAAFSATPAQPDRWREEQINLTPYIVSGQKMVIKFRNVNAFGNNIYIDDISVVPVTVGTFDAQISAIVNPVNGSTVACLPLTPVVTIRNASLTTTLTSATINVNLNGAVVGTQAWTGNLTPGTSADVTLTSVALNPPVGGNTLKIYTTLPAGLTDVNTANDTSTSVFTRIAPSTMPVTNTFETGLLPTGWTVVNPDGDFTWTLGTPGAGGSTSAARIDNYNNNSPGHIDDIRTPVINTSTGLLANDSVLITFDLAHKNFPDPTTSDTLKVMVSTNCGTSFTTVWAKGDPDLATAGSSTAPYTPASSDWKNQRISIGSNIFTGGPLLVAFRNVNGFGNFVWLDNINVIRKPRVDLQTSAIVRPNTTECTPPFAPSITVRNNGEVLITAFKVGYILNGAAPVYQVSNASLNPGATTTVTFPNLTPPSGINTIKLFVADPTSVTPGPDFTIANDTLIRTFSVPPTVPSINEGFEGSTFVPTNWSLLNPNNNVTWIRKTPGKTSDYAAFIDNYNNATIGELDIIQAPPVNTVGADGVVITFDVAHKDYPGSFDRLRVLASTNCGTSFTSVYSKSGPTLATAGDSDEDFTNPTQSEWRRDTITLNNTFAGGNVLIQFENRNDFGNNIFIDNINITPVFKRDIEVVSVSPSVVCSSSITPVATIRNRGTENVTAFSVAYAIGTGAAVTTNVTGVNIAPGATTTVTLSGGTLAVGTNNVRVYSFAPTTASGTGDQYLLNDTIVRAVAVAGSVQAPTNVVESFEGTTFPPTGWAIGNPDNSLTWQKAGVGKNSNGSAYVRNFVYYANGQKDALYTPVLNFTAVDSVKLSFDISAATRNIDDGSSLMDTLEVLVTKDCGNTFTSVYKKGGKDLQTITSDPLNDHGYVQTVEYAPNGAYLWRSETINLTSIGANGPLQVVFRNTTNAQNDVYIDNVNFRTVTLPSRLKADGVIVMPNPFGEQFNLWFVQAPSDLRYINVFNAAGQLMYKQQFGSGSGNNIIPVNLKGKAAGIYVVHIGYADKSKDKEIRIMKSNE